MTVVDVLVVSCIAMTALLCLPPSLAVGRRWLMARHPAPTFVFADLVGYSTLTANRGDLAAARLAEEFQRAMSALSRQHGAWQVKAMGDGVMIWAPNASQAIALAARAVAEVGTRSDLLPVRVGAHTGPAVMRGGDWYGSAVNIAARVASRAAPNEALITGATHAAANGDLDYSRGARRELCLGNVACHLTVWQATIQHRAARHSLGEPARP
jgi:class 3 adenylate cyclase